MAFYSDINLYNLSSQPEENSPLGELIRYKTDSTLVIAIVWVKNIIKQWIKASENFKFPMGNFLWKKNSEHDFVSTDFRKVTTYKYL